MRLPEFLTGLSPVRETLEALETGEARLASDAEEALRQLYVGTADRGLGLWEADFSLEGAGTDEARRAAIWAALAGGRTLTPALLEELCRLAASSPVPPQGGGNAQGCARRRVSEANRPQGGSWAGDGARPPLKEAGGNGAEWTSGSRRTEWSGISDGWGQVNEDFENWTVTAYAAAFGRLPPGAESLDAAVERLKPAHLAVEVHPAGVFSLEGGWRSALAGGAYEEVSGGDGVPAGAPRRAALTGGVCRELSGGDGLRAGAGRRAALEGGAYGELSGTDAARADAVRPTALTGCVLMEFFAPRFAPAPANT